ncbi:MULTISPECIES: Ada metal-binding domain-containing protein [unclassified Flavobacterium]|uniref:Ada metal-binding domain-containing protein n=1 Tax=unclassified Flavobacterium TaxID=196869 RepID=UPI003F9166C1
MITHNQITDTDLQSKIRTQKITFAGNSKLKIYGTLHCKSGKRLKRENRVFFSDEDQAIQNNFRPCGHCIKTQYQQWIYSTQHQNKKTIYCPKTAP